MGPPNGIYGHSLFIIIFDRIRMLWTLIFILEVTQSVIIHPPSDAETSVGGQVELKCTTDAVQNGEFPVEWHHVKVDLQTEIVYKRNITIGKCGTRCSVNGNRQKGEYNLVIRDVTLEDAGKYTCIDQHSRKNAEVVVFTSFPSPQSCTVSSPPEGAVGLNSCGIEPDTITLSCNTSYNGNLNLDMEWISFNGLPLTTGVSQKTVNGVNISTLVLRADQVDNPTYTCRIKYSNSNIPSKYSWTTSLNILSSRTKMVVGNCETEREECSVPTKHQCSYAWMTTNENPTKSYPGPTLNTKEVPSGMYSCSADCNVQGTTCTFMPVKVDLICGKGPTTTATSGFASWTVAAVAAPIVAVVVILVIVVIIVVRFKRRNGSSSCLRSTEKENQVISTETSEPAEKVADVEVPMLGVDEEKEPRETVKDEDRQSVLENPPEEKEDVEIPLIGDKILLSEKEDATTNKPEIQQETDDQSKGSTTDEDDPAADFVKIEINTGGIVEHVEHKFPARK